ncbi:hypothetical protein QQY66_03395 [Streptomyces sp. DG2A-72]|uniref:terpene synthase family protein n=1 Tax=Streptomyces sp. DG2A-72 TaxID=3051386 RepID=UPI00265C55EF|nr:hypothetical protein [Streptomyces sp. DG2A-72]MDO0930769.1 hypothetical protein [Streptomyces sp. DG2A-72]
MATAFGRLLDTLPPEGLQLYCPVPLQQHPSGGQCLDRAGAAWAIEQGLCAPDSRMTRMNFGTFIAHGMPFVTEEAAIAMTYYTHWACKWDDHLDTLTGNPARAAALSAEANRVLYEPSDVPLPADPFLTSLRDLRRVLQACLPPDGLAAVRSENAQWLGGQLWKLALQSSTAAPAVGEYLRMRWPKCGAGVLAAYTAPGAGYAMTPDEFYDPLVRAFTLSVFYPCTIVNDLGSLAKEAQAGQRDINLFSALAAEHGLDTTTALLKAAELYERMLCLMLRLQERLLKDPRPAVVRYAAELPQWIPATVEFTAISARYFTSDAAGTGPATPLTVSPSPTPMLWDPDDLTPPPYPDIAWMWHQLKPALGE